MSNQLKDAEYLDSGFGRENGNGRLVSISLSGYIPAMPCLAVGRLMLLFLAIVSLSADTAAKVLHGVAHQREAHEWMEHGPAHQHSAASMAEHQRSSVEALEGEADHVALHFTVTASVLPTLLMAGAVIVDLPIAAIDTGPAALPDRVAQTAPPWFRARPGQPRAPPLG